MKKGRFFKMLNTRLIRVIKNIVFVMFFSVGIVFVNDLKVEAKAKVDSAPTYNADKAILSLYLGYNDVNYIYGYQNKNAGGTFQFCVDIPGTDTKTACSSSYTYSNKSGYKLEIDGNSRKINKFYKDGVSPGRFSSIPSTWKSDGSISIYDIKILIEVSSPSFPGSSPSLPRPGSPGSSLFPGGPSYNTTYREESLVDYIDREITVKLNGYGCDQGPMTTFDRTGGINIPEPYVSRNCGNATTSIVLPPYYMGIPDIIISETGDYGEDISGEIARVHLSDLDFANPQNVNRDAGVQVKYCWSTENASSGFPTEKCNIATDHHLIFVNSASYSSGETAFHEEYTYMYAQYGMTLKASNGVEFFRWSSVGKKRFRFDCVGPELKEIPELNEYGFVTDYVYNEQGKPTAVKLKVDYDDNLSYIPKIMYCFIKIDEINKEGAVCTPDTEVDEVTAKTGSGIIVFVEEDGYYSFTVRAIDAVGNKSADTTFKVNIDLTGPKPVDEQLKSSENYTKQMEGWHYNNGDESEDHKSGTINTNNNLFKFEDVLSIVKINYNPPEIRFSKYIYPEFCISEEVSCYFPLWDYTRRQYKITVVTQKSREIGPVDQIKSMEYCWDNNNDCLSEGDWKTHGIGNEIDYPHKDETGEYEGVYNLRLRAINFAGVYSDIVTLKYNIDHEAPKSTEVDVKTYKEKICKEEICYEISGSTLGGSKNRIEITLKKDEEPSGLKSITYCFSVDGKNCIDNEEFVKSTSGDKVAISVKDRFEKLEKELLNKHNKDNEQNLERLPEANNHIIYLMFKMTDGFVLVDEKVQGEGYGAENVSDFVSKQLYYDNKIGSLGVGSGGNIFVSYKGALTGNNKNEATLMEVVVVNSAVKEVIEEEREEIKVEEVEIKHITEEKEKEVEKVLVNREEVKEVESNKEEVKLLNREVAILDMSGLKVARLLNELKCSAVISGVYMLLKDRKRINVG